MHIQATFGDSSRVYLLVMREELNAQLFITKGRNREPCLQRISHSVHLRYNFQQLLISNILANSCWSLVAHCKAHFNQSICMSTLHRIVCGFGEEMRLRHGTRYFKRVMFHFEMSMSKRKQYIFKEYIISLISFNDII